MNHKKVYDFIIQKAKNENRKKLSKNDINYIYYERHHIIPKCLGGTNTEENLVLLSGREHYVCHKLLTYIYSNNRGIILAFIRMLYSKNFEKIFSSKDYEFAKEMLSKQMTGKKLTESHKKNIGKGVKGKLKGIPKTIDAKIKMKISRIKFLKNYGNPLLGRKRPEFGKNQKGEKNPMFGKHLSINARKKIGEFQKGKPKNFTKIKCNYCGIETNPGNYIRWHNENCKKKSA
jgi:hypothetical protein